MSESPTSNKFQRFLMGILKLVMAGLIVNALGVFRSFSYTVTIGGQTYDLGQVVSIIIAFVPILLLLSALQDFDIRL
ncbi:MAG: hypothetical protein QW512_02055 [Thermofilaceae archaeon]